MTMQVTGVTLHYKRSNELMCDYSTEGFSPKKAEELSINRRPDLEQSCERQIPRRTEK